MRYKVITENVHNKKLGYRTFKTKSEADNYITAVNSGDLGRVIEVIELPDKHSI